MADIHQDLFTCVGTLEKTSVKLLRYMISKNLGSHLSGERSPMDSQLACKVCKTPDRQMYLKSSILAIKP